MPLGPAVTFTRMAAKTDPKKLLLDAVISFLSRNGVGSVSMREIGAAVGSSHRMLSYHFGTRDELLREVSLEVEGRQRERFVSLIEDESLTPSDVMRLMSEGLTAPDLAPHETLFFELYARSLRDEGDTFAADAVERWIEPVSRLFERVGLEGESARSEARLALAISRGILLDFLATNDREATQAASDRYFTRFG